MSHSEGKKRETRNGRRASDEFDRMERMMRGLLKVPKKAIREAEERGKKAHR